jgi:acetyl esterase/lipase
VAAGILVVLVSGCGGSGTTSTPTPLHGSPPALGSLSASGAGNRFYEIYDPSGPARGTMLMIHGGAWLDQRGDARRAEASTSLAFRSQGWRVVNISYTPGPSANAGPRRMLRDVVAFYDQIRRAYTGPVCAFGESAGGYLAAMLAVYRPSLKCAILDAAPLDLPTLHTIPQLVPYLRGTFGSGRPALTQWSPARYWKQSGTRTAIFGTVAANDQIVPAQQLDAFHAADPSADVAVLPAGPLPFVHGTVASSDLYARLSQLYKWLDRIAPAGNHSDPRSSGDVGETCDQPLGDGDRARLLVAGGAWQETFTTGQPIAATRGCSGSADWQDDGLSLWAFPSAAVLPAGAESSLVLSAGHDLRRLSVAFRGFLARPNDWLLGLFASASTQGPIQTKVAACERGRCSGSIALVPTRTGALVTTSGSGGDPDQSSRPPSANFDLPAGTRRIAWELVCVAPGGCSLKGTANPAGVSPRRRDPLGQPAIFSLYRVAVS